MAGAKTTTVTIWTTLFVALVTFGCRDTGAPAEVATTQHAGGPTSTSKPARPVVLSTPIDQAEHLHRTGRVKEAVAILESVARQKGPASTLERMKAREFLGRIHLEGGRYAAAEKALKLSAADFERLERERSYKVACPYQALGALYVHTGKQVAAARYFIRAADLEPHSEKMQYDAALESMMGGDFLTADKYVKRAMALSQKPGPAIEGATRDRPYRYVVLQGFILLPLQKYDQARKLFQQVLAEEPDDPGASAGLGHLAVVRKRYKEATAHLSIALKGGTDLLRRHGHKAGAEPVPDSARNPNRIYGWLCHRMASLGLGWVAANNNKHERAIGYFDGILAHRKTDLFALLGKGNSLNALGKLDRAEALFKKLSATYPDNPFVLAESALVQLNKDNHEGAEAGFKKAARLGHKKYTCPYEGLGLVYLRRGKLELAKANFKRAIANNPDIEFKKYNGLARIYIKEGRLEEARKLLLKSMANYPHDDEAKKLLATLKGKK